MKGGAVALFSYLLEASSFLVNKVLFGRVYNMHMLAYMTKAHIYFMCVYIHMAPLVDISSNGLTIIFDFCKLFQRSLVCTSSKPEQKKKSKVRVHAHRMSVRSTIQASSALHSGVHSRKV